MRGELAHDSKAHRYAAYVLHQLDQELEKRGHRFARYADDMIILVKSQRAAEHESSP